MTKLESFLKNVDSYNISLIYFSPLKYYSFEIHLCTGTQYYKYNSEADEVYEGWPRLISDDFGPKDDQSEGVPDNLDSVFFDMRDRNIYFFKGEYVSILK